MNRQTICILLGYLGIAIMLCLWLWIYFYVKETTINPCKVCADLGNICIKKIGG